MALVRAGAKHVYAVEDSCIIAQTKKIIAANNMSEFITLIDVSLFHLSPSLLLICITMQL